MGVFILKKGVVAWCAVVMAILGGMIFAGSSQKVFMSGSRNLPIYSVEREDDKIALTFNCAWGNEDINTILEALEKYDAKATFFIVGEWAEKYPDSVSVIKNAGHELGGHSYDHKDYAKLTKEQVGEDARKTFDAIKKACGAEIKLMRAPSGSYNDSCIEALEENSFIPVQWSVDTIDYGGASCDSIFQKATEKTKAGDIILMHTGTDNTSLALPRILDSLGAKYRFCTVSELFVDGDFYVDNAGKMIKKS